MPGPRDQPSLAGVTMPLQPQLVPLLLGIHTKLSPLPAPALKATENGPRLHDNTREHLHLKSVLYTAPHTQPT